jgi:hypothetical protein
VQISAVASNKMTVKIAARLKYNLCSYVLQTTVVATWFSPLLQGFRAQTNDWTCHPVNYSTVYKLAMGPSTPPCLVIENVVETPILCSTI